MLQMKADNKLSQDILKLINAYLAEYVIQSPRTEYEKGWNAAIHKMQTDNAEYTERLVENE